MQRQRKTKLTKEQKKIINRYLNRYPRASLVLVYYLAVFVLIGSLLVNTNADIIQWNLVIQVALILLVTSSFSWVVHIIAASALAQSKTNENYVHAKRLANIATFIFYPCLVAAVILLIIAIAI